MNFHHRPARVLAGALLAFLVIGGSACSGDDDDGSAGGGATTVADGGRNSAGGGGGGGLDPDSDRPFDVGRDDLAHALGVATSAESSEVDGETIRLIYSGPKNDVTVGINCRVALDMRDGSDKIELVYDDGTIDCDELE